MYFYNFSGWDVYRSQMALVGLMAPALSQDMAISLLESGYVNGTELGHKTWRPRDPALDDGLSRNRCDDGRSWSSFGFLAVHVRESKRIPDQHAGGSRQK